MKERPILFSAPMVRAILEGRKTQTRRVIKGKGTWSVEAADDFSSRKWPGHEDEYGTWTDMECPYGYPSDRLWVRETWRQTIDDKSFVVVQYRADETIRSQLNDHGGEGDPVGTREHKQPLQRVGKDGPPWKPSIFMPRWASRITLEITDVRVERLQDISNEDAAAEGMPSLLSDEYCEALHTSDMLYTHRAGFKDYLKNHGHMDWDANPWVWVVQFEVVQ